MDVIQHIVGQLLGTYVFPSNNVRYIFIDPMAVLLSYCVCYHRGRCVTDLYSPVLVSFSNSVHDLQFK